MASCTTTIVIVSTSAARLTIDAATVPRISMAASGPPLIHSRDQLVVERPINCDRAER